MSQIAEDKALEREARGKRLQEAGNEWRGLTAELGHCGEEQILLYIQGNAKL